MRLLATIGAAQILIILFLFFRFAFNRNIYSAFEIPFARILTIFVMISFCIKMSLQFLIIFKDIGHIVFGYRPIIIGFLHLVFLATVTFYIFSNHIERGNFQAGRINSYARFALSFLCAAIFFNEAVLLFQGFGIFLETSHPIFPWLLWIASICLLIGAGLVFSAFVKQKKGAAIAAPSN